MFFFLIRKNVGSGGHLRRDGVVVVLGGRVGVGRREAASAGGGGGRGRQRHARVQGRRHPRAHNHLGESTLPSKAHHFHSVMESDPIV